MVEQNRTLHKHICTLLIGYMTAKTCGAVALLSLKHEDTDNGHVASGNGYGEQVNSLNDLTGEVIRSLRAKLDQLIIEPVRILMRFSSRQFTSGPSVNQRMFRG